MILLKEYREPNHRKIYVIRISYDINKFNSAIMPGNVIIAQYRQEGCVCDAR